MAIGTSALRSTVGEALNGNGTLTVYPVRMLSFLNMQEVCLCLTLQLGIAHAALAQELTVGIEST
jgi:hypothetical protein